MCVCVHPPTTAFDQCSSSVHLTVYFTINMYVCMYVYVRSTTASISIQPVLACAWSFNSSCMHSYIYVHTYSIHTYTYTHMYINSPSPRTLAFRKALRVYNNEGDSPRKKMTWADVHTPPTPKNASNTDMDKRLVNAEYD